MFLGSKRRPARKADLTAICEPTVYKMWKPRRLTTLWASRACHRDSFTFTNLETRLPYCITLGKINQDDKIIRGFHTDEDSDCDIV
jgi:hypothetical protein